MLLLEDAAYDYLFPRAMSQTAAKQTLAAVPSVCVTASKQGLDF